jgi:Major tropism determinant N-terminal domain
MSVQVKWRRGTLSQVQAFTGAQGEIAVTTDTNELYLQDGSTAGGWPTARRQMPFGSLAQLALIESTGVGGETLTTGVLTYTSTVQLPAGYKFIMGAGWRVETTITGPTGTFNFGVTGSPTLFASTQSPSIAAGSTVIYGQNQLRWDASPVSLLLTSNTGNFTAGAIRFVVHYILLSPPTS